LIKGGIKLGYNFWSGEKIRLRAVEPSDAGTFFKWSSDYDHESDRFCDEIHFPSSYDAMVGRVENKSKREPSNDEFMWIIENKEGIAVGCINTFDCNRRVGCFKYGLGIARDYWGKGYAKEAVNIVLRYYFRELRYQKVTVYIYSFNERSIKLHESLGFQYEGRTRRTAFTNGNYYDEIFYGMTCEEFDAIDKKPELK
jgi:RimJ/RimL family protein N-acetyltransferase